MTTETPATPKRAARKANTATAAAKAHNTATAGAKAQAAMKAQTAVAPKPEPASSQPREYLVYREVPVPADMAKTLGVEGESLVLVELGTAHAKTAKEARRTVAKAKLDEAELRTDTGVPLRAITRTAAEAGRGVARLKVEPTWAD